MADRQMEPHVSCLHDHIIKASPDHSSLSWEFQVHEKRQKRDFIVKNSDESTTNVQYHSLHALREGLLVLRYKKDQDKGITDFTLLYLHRYNPDTANQYPAEVIPVENIVDKDDHSAKISDVTLSGADESPGRRRLACCLQLLLEESILYEMYTSTVFVYDLDTHDFLLTLQPSSLVWPSVCFATDKTLDLAGVTDSDSGFSITAIDVKSGHPVAWSSMDDIVDLSGDSYCQLTRSPDGCFYTLLVMESILSDREILCRAFAVEANTLQVVLKYKPRLMRPCHWGCIFSGQPRFSRCGGQFTVPHVGKTAGFRKVCSTFELPKVLSLKHMARSAVLRNMTEGGSVAELGLKEQGLVDYLGFV